MPRFSIFSLVSVILLSSSIAAAEPLSDALAAALDEAPYRFVGFSDPTNLLVGGPGLPALYDACQDSVTGFGPEARMCSTREFILSTNVDFPTATHAWIRPTIVGSGGGLMLDISGHSENTVPNSIDFTCRGWTKIFAGSGLVVRGMGVGTQSPGGISLSGCEQLGQVTCCAPLQ